MKKHQDMFQFVRNQLDEYHVGKKKDITNKLKIDYKRYDHIVRVYKWMERIVFEMKDDNLDEESLRIATIFHDCGYGQETETKTHAHVSAEICRDYLNRRDYKPEQVELIYNLIYKHSDKKLLYEKNTPIELVVLMEADMLDDTGALGVILDAWIEAKDLQADFESFARHIKKYTYSHMKNVELVTAPGKKFWHEKRMLVYDFIRQYERDLGMEQNNNINK